MYTTTAAVTYMGSTVSVITLPQFLIVLEILYKCFILTQKPKLEDLPLPAEVFIVIVFLCHLCLGLFSAS